MAVNQQLKDYISQQLKLGVSKDVVKSTLLGAGWSESDVSEAMASVESPAVSQSVSPAAAGETKPVEQAQPVTNPSETVGTVKSLEVKPEIKTPAAGSEKIPPASFVTSDIFRAKDEPLFQPKETAQKPSLADKPQIISVNEKAAKTAPRQFVLPLILGILLLASLAAAGFFYYQNSGSQDQINSLSQENSSLRNQLSAFSNDKSNLTSQISSLNDTINELKNELSIFAIVGTSTAELPVTVKGILSTGGRAGYSLTTANNIVVYVKNSKDAKVEAALKPLVGSELAIGGTHSTGSSSITVTTINGQPLELFGQQQSTSTPATSTTP